MSLKIEKRFYDELESSLPFGKIKTHLIDCLKDFTNIDDIQKLRKIDVPEFTTAEYKQFDVEFSNEEITVLSYRIILDERITSYVQVNVGIGEIYTSDTSVYSLSKFVVELRYRLNPSNFQKPYDYDVGFDYLRLPDPS